MPSATAMPTRERRSARDDQARARDEDFEKLRSEAESAASTRAGGPRQSTAGLFRAVCSTDLLFLIDTTASMGSYLEAAKQQIRSIVDDIHTAFFNEAEIRMAVVGYKDHSDSPNIQFLDFTTSIESVRSFLSNLRATGGADAPEDVLGGLQQATYAAWKHKTRCIIHIADAPPHGRILHDLGDTSDNYPSPGSEPHRLTHEPLLRKMLELRINYCLLRVNASTDRMAYTFLQAYTAASAHGTLISTNRYYSLSGGDRKGSSNAAGGLLFQEAGLGITFNALRRLVLSAVTTSATHTAIRTVAQESETAARNIDERDNDGALSVELEEVPPEWEEPEWLNETLIVQGFSPDVVIHGANTLNGMMARDDNITMSRIDLTLYKRNRPFAQGALRVAAYAGTDASDNHYVVKWFKKPGARIEEFVEDMRAQALCKSFALEFNTLLGKECSIDFVVTACFKGRSETTAGDAYLSLEPYIEGTQVKYNGNDGYVNIDIPEDAFNQEAQAFSHFTFERSRGQFLVCDLQGVGELLTDPVIHTRDPSRFNLSRTNTNEDGFKFFFRTHECNDICRRLKLKSSGTSLFIQRSFEFREDWPTLADTVCCSNKLCGRILVREDANDSKTYPGYHWCDVCWPQLESFTSEEECTAEDPAHLFRESKFFYESQGRNMPLECPEHREESISAIRTDIANSRKDAAVRKENEEKGLAVPSTAVAGAALWDKLESATVQGGDDE
jgi:hypothetical protein